MNKKIRKIIVIILTIALMGSQTTFAETIYLEQNEDLVQEVSKEIPILIDTIYLEEISEFYLAPDVKSIISSGQYAGIGQQITDQFYSGVIGLQSMIYLNNYGISLSQLKNNIIESVWETRNMNPYVFGNSMRVWQYSNKYRLECIDSAVSDVWIYNDNTIEIIYADKNIIETTNRELEDIVTAILARCSEVESNIEKELIIHDYLVLNGKYDYENYLNDTLPKESYSAYGILVKGTGVCQAYAYAMKLLLRREGIPCDVVIGGNHGWNIVNIDGENYYVDATWDDPVPDVQGRIGREHFNVTNEQLAGSGHEWEANDYPLCDSEKYAFLQIADEWIYKNGIWYYTASGYSEEMGYYVTNNLYAYNEEAEEKKQLVLGSCTAIRLDIENEGIYYTKRGEEQYYDFYGNIKETLIPFVNRFYQACLERAGDEEGLHYWADQLAKGEKTGAQLAEDFIYAQEFTDKALDHEMYIKVMYNAFFGRAADQDGLNYWVDLLERGVSRKYILAQFVASQEFEELCDTYHIVRGTLTLEAPADCYINLTQFVYRFYQKALGRGADQVGLNYWVNELHEGNLTGSNLAESILLSKEFTSKNLKEDIFLEVMYQVFFDRVADIEGMNYWKQYLSQGTSRQEMLEKFINSSEFKQICKNYKIRY